MKVAKFGGTSLADAGQIMKVFEIVKADPDRRIIVVSAPGKRSKEDIKVTDLLIACAQAMWKRGEAEQELATVVARFADIHKALDLPVHLIGEIEKDLRERLAGDRKNAGPFMDSIKAAGEDYSARLVAAAFTAKGLKAQYVSPRDAGMLLSDEPGNAQVLDESYPKLATLRDRSGVTIFPGFFGYTKTGEVVTFPRGGSDITGAILAAAVKADVYENFTDVDCGLRGRSADHSRGAGDRAVDLPGNAGIGVRRLRGVPRRSDRARREGRCPDLHQEHEPAFRAGHDDRSRTAVHGGGGRRYFQQ